MSKTLRVPVDGLEAGRVELGGPLARYVSRVHRLGAGARLLLFDPSRGVEADAVLLEVRHSSISCDVEEVRASGYAAHPITLLQGLAKGAKPDLTLRDATALGVSRVIFAETERAVVRLPGERAATRQERWQRIAADAARQSGRGNLPSIEGPLPVAQALARCSDPVRVLLSARGRPLLEQVNDWDGQAPLALLVGPEGGFAPDEIALAEAAGFAPASLGPTVLRTELASVAALGALAAFLLSRSER